MSDRFFSPSEAALRLGVSAKALRLYEQRGLLTPGRTDIGWRVYGPDQMERAAAIAALRALGFSLTQVGRVMNGEAEGLEPALAAHQAQLESRLGVLAGTIRQIGRLREDLAQGRTPSLQDLARLSAPVGEVSLALDLPWPWGGERFELRDLAPVTYIIGPLGSGKTRLARAIADSLPGAVFSGLDRRSDSELSDGIAQTMDWLEEEGATLSPALTAIVQALASDAAALVFDLIEQGLDEATQQALAAWLRRTASPLRPLFVMTRSTAILDLAAVGPDEAILLCPANHSPPTLVAARPGAPGYEAVATCLASPQVRARTEGMVAFRPAAAATAP